MSFYKWFTTFIEEKELDLSDYCHKGVQYGDVCQGICDTTAEEQAQIKATLVWIDCKNGDIKHYLKHLGQAHITG